jgi:L-ascorbate metabolism protein UlaG (beta-lactamase superfamily)
MPKHTVWCGQVMSYHDVIPHHYMTCAALRGAPRLFQVKKNRANRPATSGVGLELAD